MKSHQPTLFLTALILLSATVNFLGADSTVSGRPPVLDSQGRFWIYRNGPAHPKMPFSPYGWMSDGTNLSQIIQVDLECRDHPDLAVKPAIPEREYCVRMKVTWGDATWASVAFISGLDKPAWWGETENGGKYYNLGTLTKKKLVFYARGSKGGEAIKAQIGALGDKPYGDSLVKPIITEELKLTPDWTRFEVDLKDVPSSELASICNGFGVVVEQANQPGTGEIQFYLDDIYFE